MNIIFPTVSGTRQVGILEPIDVQLATRGSCKKWTGSRVEHHQFRIGPHISPNLCYQQQQRESGSHS